MGRNLTPQRQEIGRSAAFRSTLLSMGKTASIRTLSFVIFQGRPKMPLPLMWFPRDASPNLLFPNLRYSAIELAQIYTSLCVTSLACVDL
jgi:hypothetical protein